MREQIYRIVGRDNLQDKYSKSYDVFIMVVALLSVTPLMFKTTNPFLEMLDVITVYILFLDYIFRWITCDFTKKKNSKTVFYIYPFTPFAILNLASLLPSLGLLGPSFRILRLFRIVIVLRYSKTFIYISNVFKNERKTLGYVLIIALFYIFISALAMFSYEPETFDSFFDALYWATTALTTVGYGDVYPLTDVGKFISMISSLFGIAVIALPAGIVTAGFLEEINAEKVNQSKKNEREGDKESD
ncbi:MAG: ion transporter [Eubacteriaceae bacterium]